MAVRKIELDNDKNRIIVDGESVRVPPGILLLMHYLLQHPLEWLTTSKISQALWRAGQFSEVAIQAMLEVLGERLGKINQAGVLVVGLEGYMLDYQEGTLENTEKVVSTEDAESGEYLIVSGVKLTLATGEATCGGSSNLVRGYEFKVLQYLMTRAGQSCSRQEILDAVWGRGETKGYKVDNCVKKIRDKLGVDGYRLIQSIHGVGYEFVKL